GRAGARARSDGANLGIADRHCPAPLLSRRRAVRAGRVRFIGTRVPFCWYAHCAMRNPTGSIARAPTTLALPASGTTEVPPLPPLDGGSPSGPMARWVRVLEAFAESGEWGIRDLARATEIPRSAAHRILHDMAALGLLAPADEPGRFRVGADLARIGLLVAEHLDIRRVGRPFLERASAAIGETVVIAVYDPVRRQFSAVDAVETSHPIRYLWESLRDWSDLH